MILGIGTDLAQISRIAQAMERPRFIERVLSPAERERAPDPITASWLAKRWAAKEAASKALGTGIGSQLGFYDIEIQTLATGAPQLSVAKHGGHWHVSLSDDGDYAQAFVVWSK